MKLHYKGKYDLNPESLPHGEHKPGAVRFKEAEDTKELAVIANVLCLMIMIVLAILVFVRCRHYIAGNIWQMLVGALASLLPNIVFGFIPFIIGMVYPRWLFLAMLGVCATGMGAGDYYNVYNALTQMPKGARTYLYQFNSYWYMP